jgi:hypothetical protein
LSTIHLPYRIKPGSILSLAKESNPSDELMIRFAGHKPVVKKVSEAVHKGGGVLDKKTGKKSIIFQVTSIQWLGETEAEVEGGYYEGNLSSSGNVYRVIYENKEWVVKEDKMKWIS